MEATVFQKKYGSFAYKWFTQAESIAETFKQSFSDSCFDSYCDKSRPSFDELCTRLHSKSEMSDSSTNNVFSVSDIEKALSCLKSGQAAGVDNIVKEHLIHSHPALIVHLKLMFNIMSVHGFVPDGFGIGIIVPIVKDNMGDITDVNNYRGITLCPVISKLFEYCMLHKYESYMTSNDLQFGFKRNLGCSHAAFVLRQRVEYFTAPRGSNVFMASLDAKKAFDREKHIKLFNRIVI